MNRLSPWIVRRNRSAYLPRARPFAAVVALPQPRLFEESDGAKWLEELRLFATGWIGGLIFFGTLIG